MVVVWARCWSPLGKHDAFDLAIKAHALLSTHSQRLAMADQAPRRRIYLSTDTGLCTIQGTNGPGRLILH